MEPITAAALIAGGTQAVNTATSTARSKRMAKYQDAINVKNWNAQNEYNLPKNQMSRYKDAGLNPNLMYGQGNSGNSTSVAPANVKEFSGVGLDPNKVMQVLESFQNIEKIRATTELTKTQKAGSELDNMQKDLSLGINLETRNDVVNKIINDSSRAGYEQTTSNINMMVKNIELEYKKRVSATELLNLSYDAERKSLENDLRKITLAWMSKSGLSGTKDIMPLVLQAIKMYMAKDK